MAQPGNAIAHSVTVALPPEVAFERMRSGLVACPDYEPTYSGPGSLVLTRKFIPTWAIVLAVVGAFLFLLGLLFLLIKETETLNVTVEPAEGGSKVTITGIATDDAMRRIQGSLEAAYHESVAQGGASTTPSDAGALAPPAAAAAAAAAAAPTTPAPAPDERACPHCGGTIKAAAKVCRHCGTRFD